MREDIMASDLKIFSRFRISTMVYLSLAVVGMLVLALSVEGAPLPAPNLDNCHSQEQCCLPYSKAEPKKFEFNPNLPMRTRRPAHLADETYIAKLEKAYDLLRALPKEDPRSLSNQANLHCLYCDDTITYDNVTNPLEIHNGWFFLPWHRLFLYFHERILAKLLGDDTFTLPYWNWDNQSPVEPIPNKLPHFYARRNSSLHDENRNQCAQPPYLADLDSPGGCVPTPNDVLRSNNNRLMYTQIVTGAVTPRLFFGAKYHLGDAGGFGPGTLEEHPHGQIHIWVGDLNLPHAADMGNFGTAARDPVFYAHHTNVDRLWTVWKNLPGGYRKDITDKDWLDSEFVFIDENGDRVVVKVSDALDPKLLRYKYQSLPDTWVSNGVKAGHENKVPVCFPASKKEIHTLMKNTPRISSSRVLLNEVLTFRVRRPPPPATKNAFEVLVIEGINMDFSQLINMKAWLFYPTASANSSISCPEFIGAFDNIPHAGQAMFTPKREWRVAIGDKLKAVGRDYVSHIVVTLVQGSLKNYPVTFSSAKVVYDMNEGF